MTLQQSARLRPDVDLFAVADGHVLRVGDSYHHVHLDAGDADHLLDALVDGGAPPSPAAAHALSGLVEAGLVDVAPTRHTVVGGGVLARAVRGALGRMGGTLDPDGTLLTALDDDTDLPADGAACWVSDGHVLLSPPAVGAPDVAARREAATRHRTADPRTTPAPGGRVVVPPPSPAGLELAAALVAAELLRSSRPAYEAVVVDLRALTVSRHPVLPVPPAPR